MKIFELFNPENFKKEDFDLKDDLIFYMNSQPEFYRKQFYPTMCKFKTMHESGKNVSPTAFKSLVEKAFQSYKNEFPVEGIEKSLTKEFMEEICAEIHKVELENIKQGHYDGN